VRQALLDEGAQSVESIAQRYGLPELGPRPGSAASQATSELDPTAQKVADQLSLSQMPDNMRLGRSYGEKKSWYFNENEGSWGDGIWGWGTDKDTALKDYKQKWLDRFNKTGAKTFAEVAKPSPYADTGLLELIKSK